MTIVKFLTSAEFGCCNVSELLALKRDHPEDVDTLKQWAREEMQNRGIEVEDK